MTDRERKAYDRGSATKYYGRIPRPHIWTSNNPQTLTEVQVEDMTDSEIAAYWQGYSEEMDTKDYGL